MGNNGTGRIYLRQTGSAVPDYCNWICATWTRLVHLESTQSLNVQSNVIPNLFRLIFYSEINHLQERLSTSTLTIPRQISLRLPCHSILDCLHTMAGTI